MRDSLYRSLVIGFLVGFLGILSYQRYEQQNTQRNQRNRYNEYNYKSLKIEKHNRDSVEKQDVVSSNLAWSIQDKTSVAQVILSLLTILFTAIVGLIAWGTYCAAKDQAKEAKRQADAAVESFINNDRPVLVESASTSSTQDGIMIPSIKLQNVGTRPAILNIVEMYINLDGNREPDNVPFKNEAGALFGPAVVKPGEDATIHATPISTVFAQKRTSTEAFYGYINYSNPSTSATWRIKFSFLYVKQDGRWKSEYMSTIGRNMHERIDKHGNAIPNPLDIP